jgi:hypothetical protein
VATFTDADPSAVAGDFAATIDWGDGTSTAGTVTTSAGSGFAVKGSHAYTQEGTKSVNVTIADLSGNTATAVSTADIADATLAATGGVTVAATEGAQFSSTVATFTDANPNAAASDFTATIDWGDATITAGTVTTVASGGFAVSGSHAYAEEGTQSVKVTIADAGGSTATAVSTADIADAPLSAQGVTAAATEDAAFSGTVAMFTDPGGGEAKADYGASIVWGDGNTSSGTINGPDGSGVFTVSGTNIYAAEGTYTATVTITHDAAAPVTLSPKAIVGDPSVSATAVAISATEGAATTVNVATFTDPGGAEARADYSASIVWGDGNRSPGTISGPDSNGVFTVSGTNAYAEEGTYTATVTIAHDTAATVTVAPKATVGDPSVSAAALAISATEGASAAVNVATFTDPSGAEAKADYSASIAWGDGNTSSGTISGPDSNGVFTVSGMNAYAEEGTYTATVTIAHDAAASATVAPKATVSDAALHATGVPVSATQGTNFGSTGFQVGKGARSRPPQ